MVKFITVFFVTFSVLFLVIGRQVGALFIIVSAGGLLGWVNKIAANLMGLDGEWYYWSIWGLWVFVGFLFWLCWTIRVAIDLVPVLEAVSVDYDDKVEKQ